MAVSTTAKTRKDVDSTAAKDRLWDSLNYSYGKRGEQITKDYNKLASQTSNQLLSRGMQRSSYGAQTVANVGKQMADALAQNSSDMIADYENRLYQIERDEKADEQWERQFSANREDAAWNKEFQTSQFDYTKSQDAIANAFREKEFAANREDAAWNKSMQQQQFEYSKQRDAVADAQWQKQYDEQLRQFNEQMAYQRERANVSDAQWQKEYDQAKAQFDAQMAEQKRQFDLEYNLKASAASGGGGGGGGNGGATGNPSGNDTTAPTTDTEKFLDDLFAPATNGTTSNTTPITKAPTVIATSKNNSLINNKTRVDKNKMTTGIHRAI